MDIEIIEQGVTAEGIRSSCCAADVWAVLADMDQAD